KPPGSLRKSHVTEPGRSRLAHPGAGAVTGGRAVQRPARAGIVAVLAREGGRASLRAHRCRVPVAHATALPADGVARVAGADLLPQRLLAQLVQEQPARVSGPPFPAAADRSGPAAGPGPGNRAQPALPLSSWRAAL